jgi:hypothetical protein
MNEEPETEKPVLWPNQQEPIEGIEPTSETNQDPDFIVDDVDTEMED